MVSENGYTTYTEVNHFLDVAIQLAEEENDSAVLKYAIKTLSGNIEISDKGKNYRRKKVDASCNTVSISSSLLERYVFTPFEVPHGEY